MAEKGDGGGAFPEYQPETDRNYAKFSRGMTIRDYFAAAALKGILAHPIGLRDANGEGRDIGFHGIIAYKYADAMLVAREK